MLGIFSGVLTAEKDGFHVFGQTSPYAETSFGIRIRLEAISLRRKSPATQARPRCLVLRIVPCCLPQRKMHSIILRRVCDIP